MDQNKIQIVEVVGEYNMDKQKVLRHFIETYKNLPELWNSTHPMYVNKSKRRLALVKLAEIYARRKPGANVADVRKKINTLRCNYRKELKKVIASKNSGSGAHNVYVPTSWVFYALQFLDKCDQPVNANVKQTDEITESDGEMSKESYWSTSTPNASWLSMMTQPRPPQPPQPPPPQPNKRRNIEKSTNTNALKSDELLRKACDYLEKSYDDNAKLPSIARAWGEQLLTLEQNQRLFAEKAINDVLFEARRGTLNLQSVKINENFWGVDSPDLSNNNTIISVSEHDSSQFCPSDEEPPS